MLAWLVRLNAVLTVLDIMRPGVADRLARTDPSALLDGATVALAIASAGATAFVGMSLADLDGERVLGATRTWIA